MDKDKITERWDNLGLLNGLNGNKKVIVANKFEELANYLMNHDNLSNVGNIPNYKVVLFPIIRKIFSDTDIECGIVILISLINDAYQISKSTGDVGNYEEAVVVAIISHAIKLKIEDSDKSLNDLYGVAKKYVLDKAKAE